MIYLGAKQNSLEKIEAYEQKFADLVGSKYAIAVSSGTMADTVAMAVMKAQNPDKKKVLVPALTFVAQINSIMYNGLTPVFYDVLTEDIPDDILCIFPVHLLGMPAQIPKTTVPIIEDTCEALGSMADGKYLGTIGDMGTYSTYVAHTISTGEGGMIVTNNKEKADLARRLRNHSSQGGDITERFKFAHIGFNGKMSIESAENGLAALDNAEEVFQKRNDNYLYLGGGQFEGERIVPHALPVQRDNRDEFMHELQAKGIDSRRLFSCVPVEEEAYAFMGYKKGDFPQSEHISNKGLYVPCHEALTKEELDTIKEAIA